MLARQLDPSEVLTMFRHCVLLKFSDDTTEDQRQAVIEAMRSLPDHIEQCRTYVVGFNAGDRDDNYDIAAVGDFESKADYDIYAEHPYHLKVIQESIAPVLAGRAAIQYEY